MYISFKTGLLKDAIGFRLRRKPKFTYILNPKYHFIAVKYPLTQSSLNVVRDRQKTLSVQPNREKNEVLLTAVRPFKIRSRRLTVRLINNGLGRDFFHLHGPSNSLTTVIINPLAVPHASLVF